MARKIGLLGTLDEEQHSFLVGMLSLGKTDVEMADSLIEKKWLDPGLKRLTVIRNINRWRKNKGQEAVLKQVTDALTTSTGKLKRQIDVVEELTILVIKQKERVKKMAEKEDPTPLLLQTVTDEMRVLMTGLEKLGKLQLDTGILRKVRVGESEGDYAEPPVIDNQEDEIFTEEHRRLMEIAQKQYPQLLGPTE